VELPIARQGYRPYPRPGSDAIVLWEIVPPEVWETRDRILPTVLAVDARGSVRTIPWPPEVEGVADASPAGFDARGRLIVTVGGRVGGFLEGLPARSWIAAFDLDAGEVTKIYP